MPFFNINFNALIWQVLPVRLRKTVTYAWLKCLSSPVIWLYNLFAGNRSNNLYLLGHDSQVAYMQAALNDTFDPAARRIYITDGPFEDPLFMYLVPENKPLWLGLVSEIGSTSFPDPQPLYTDGETSLLGIAFIVMVPVAVPFDMARMKALVDLYRLPGRNNYQIITF